jgi:hypothetical protein
MGLADKLADIIRPRPAGLFSGLAPATTPGLSAASILSGAASEIACESVRAFMRALETMRDPEVASRVDAFRDADEAATRATLEARGYAYLGLSADGVPTYQLQGKLQSVVVHLNIPADDTPPALAPTQSPVKVTWGGVPLRGFADDEYFSIEIDKLNQQAASFHDSLLKSAGFDDVAARGTPPPIVLSHPRVPTSITCHVEGGLPTEDGRKIRETIRQVFDEQSPAELVRGIREAKPGIMY